ncbi:cold shock domain-containing protein [Streptomyces sp. NPDC050211]|uniref:cold-shock protein n=1 Tax=Streptomyces sp. NPDC050211 TaxID=3154932 RepID=UPI0034268259
MIEATVTEWDDEQGWGVLDSRETPGGCWTHFSTVEMPGFRSLAPGQKVTLEWEAVEQDGYQYRAVRVVVAD